MQEEFFTLKPKDKRIAQHVDYYYVHRCTDPNFYKKYKFYPHLKHAVSMYSDAVVKLDGNSSKVTGTPNNGYSAIYTQVMNAPFEVEMTGPIHKVAIAFKPLGLLNFLPDALEKYCTKIITPFNPYADDFTNLLEQLFKPKAEIVHLLDEFLAVKYVEFQQPAVQHVANALMDVNNEKTIQDLATELQVSRKTLLRKFKKHLCCSPEEFRRVARFRHSLSKKLKSDQDANLTSIAHESNYYDQADFVRNYKRITGQNPTKFLKTGTLLGNEDTFWNLITE